MEEGNRSKNPTESTKKKKFHHYDESKFSIVSCPVTESYCHEVLNEINELYAQSELSRINKEYLKSVYLLEEAYRKTDELSHKHCLVCAELFQFHIKKTLDLMKGELQEISNGMFGKNNYRLAYARLCDWEYK